MVNMCVCSFVFIVTVYYWLSYNIFEVNKESVKEEEEEAEEEEEEEKFIQIPKGRKVHVDTIFTTMTETVPQT